MLQTDRTDRIGQSDRIGQTVLQTVTQKLKPGLVASFDIWPGNGEGLFWLSLTYLLTHLSTYFQPWTHTGQNLMQIH